MLLKDLVHCLTKYYVIRISNTHSCYEDQTMIPQGELEKEVMNFDFLEDDGDGESLIVFLRNNERR